MKFIKTWVGAALFFNLAVTAHGAQAVSLDIAASFAAETASADARYLARWVLDTGDHHGQPFVLVDKKAARVYVFSAQGQLLGATAALLGSASGDLSAPGVGQLMPSQIPAAQRTTPAGRFASEPGHNAKGEDIVWFDYDAGLALHRLRPAPAYEQRPARMLSPTPEDNRISLGCVVVPVAFYDTVVGPLLGRQRGVVYVMPETQPVQALFAPRLHQQQLAALKP